MKVSIFGLGYVGCVSAACLAKKGHQILGVDINPEKVKMINSGRSPIIETGLAELISGCQREGRIQATTNSTEAVLETDMSLVCVGTPSEENGRLNLAVISEVSREIGQALSQKKDSHCVVFRSTVLPGTVRNILIPFLTNISGRKVNEDFDVCFNPEFLREGSSIHDFYHPPFTVIGEMTSRGGDLVADLYKGIEAPIKRVSCEVAEMLKYVCNCFHALKITFANEIGVLAKGLGIDSHQVMELFVQDKKLNISSAYLKPGFAFGGSCLPKDLRALLYKAKELDLQIPVLASVLESNRVHVERVVDKILKTRKKRIGVLGLSFKPGTDDLRESPIVTLVETMIGKGYQVRIFDSEVSLAGIFGANKEFIEREIPHISNLMCRKIEDVIEESELIVIAKADEAYTKALEPIFGKKAILDLTRVKKEIGNMGGNYDGICW